MKEKVEEIHLKVYYSATQCRIEINEYKWYFENNLLSATIFIFSIFSQFLFFYFVFIYDYLLVMSTLVLDSFKEKDTCVTYVLQNKKYRVRCLFIEYWICEVEIRLRIMCIFIEGWICDVEIRLFINELKRHGWVMLPKVQS